MRDVTVLKREDFRETYSSGLTSFPEPHYSLSLNLIPKWAMGSGVLKWRSPSGSSDEIGSGID